MPGPVRVRRRWHNPLRAESGALIESSSIGAGVPQHQGTGRWETAVSHGWTGTSLFLRLEDGGTRLFDREVLRRSFLGGRGYGVALLSEFGSPSLPPLDAQQPIVFSAGPVTGTSVPSSGRFAAVGASPLTGTVLDSNAGGRFGVRLRAAGLDALVIQGRAAEWSVVVVDGRGGERSAGEGPQVRLIPLSELWPEADATEPEPTSSGVVSGLRERLGSGYSLLFPAGAGRRGALLGSLRTDDRRNLGRGGLGAVLGGKQVFAVAVAGEGLPPSAEPDHLSFLQYEAEKQLAANPVTSRALPEFGTAVLVNLLNQAGALPAKNFTASCWERAEVVSGEALRDGPATGRRGCFGCRIRCTRRVGKGKSGGEGPEYETIWAMGPACGVSDLSVILEANRLCGEYGLDTISTGATIACAMELAESGVLGRELRFGDGVRLLEIVREMGEGRGFGAELADGSARFALRYGHAETAMHVKGLEMPAYDPRGMQGQGLAYATSNRGACHLRGNMLGPEILGIPKMVDRFSAEGKAGLLINLQHLYAAFDSACMCKFAGLAFGEEILARMIEAVTGVGLAPQELLACGERTWNLERMWNMAAGFSREDDTLPPRLLEESVSTGPAAGKVVDLEPMLDEYYRARGWGADGVPEGSKIASLGLVGQMKSLGLGEARPLLQRSDLPPLQGWRARASLPTAPPGSPVQPEAGGRGKGARHLRSV